MLSAAKIHSAKRTASRAAASYFDTRRTSGVLQRQAGLDEVHVVESIVGFRAELDAMTFPRQRERFRDAEIEVLHARQAHQGPRSRRRPGIGVRETVYGVGIGEQARVAGAVVAVLHLKRPSRNRESVLPVIDVPSLVALNDAGQTAGESHDARNLPAAENLIRPARSIVPEWLALADRQFVHHVDVHLIADIEIGRAAELARVEYVLNHGAILAGGALGRRCVVDGMRKRVVKVEGKP